MIYLEILMNINTFEEKVHRDMDKIRDIILDMNKNSNEEHEKVMKYINKIAKLCYSERNEESQVIGTLLNCLTFQLNCKNITVQKDWLDIVRIKY